ncbi:MAG TPA: helix-turn-helix transcriptional regulator [Candidatus Merdivicinus intestinavium]|nr:helix-turn-helix transcriptional regulator [Candidatus Merdivicinus intestinavium]
MRLILREVYAILKIKSGEGIMRPFKFVKGPGYVYDLFYIFSLYFNRKERFDLDANMNKVESDLTFQNQILQDFSPIPSELELFFHLRKNSRGFLPTYYFNPYQNHFSNDFDFNFLLQELSDHERLIENLIEFYFPNMNHKDIVKEKNSILEMSKRIDTADEYDETIKRKLYSFLVNPEPIIQKLIYELMAKELLLSQYYAKNYQQIVDMQNEFDFNIFAQEMKEFRNIDFLATEANNEIYISTCLLNKNCVCLFVQSECTTILLGYDYHDSILTFFSQRHQPSLKEFGDIITEQNRIDILNLLVERKEVTIKDLEKLLNFSGSTAYYHLTMMMRYNMVKTRNQGRTVFYSLNEQYFESIIKVLSKYLKKG